MPQRGEGHQRPHLILHLPPRAYKICALCKSKFIVPITPLKTTFEIDGKAMSRTQLPLRLAWAVTIHKSQGLTLGRIKLGLGKGEFLTGLMFVALSQVKALNSIIIVSQVDYSRVQKLGGKHVQHCLGDYACRYHLACT